MPNVYKIIDTSSGETVATVDAEEMVINNGIVTFYESTYSKIITGVFAVTAGMLVAKREKEKPNA